MDEKNGGEVPPFRVLEFYSGIGGMRYSLLAAKVHAEVVEAFDINDVANDVYQHNFGHRPFQGNIQTLTAADLDSYRAHAWLLSPPCQPYTRQGLQKHSGDARASSFLKILELIPTTLQPPSLLFVENVVGFETSDTHAKMVEILTGLDFSIQGFILSPLHFGVPYSRPRYFCLAKRKPLSFQCEIFNRQIIRSLGPLSEHNDSKYGGDDQPLEDWDKLVQDCEPIERFLEFKVLNSQIDSESCFLGVNNVPRQCCGALEVGFEEKSGMMDQYLVPLSLVERWGSAMDIVYPNSRRCCCFTKSYYRYVKGTGSLLATVQPMTRDKGPSLKELGLRYFTPREVANLHSFPEDFQFPSHISLRQRYALLGNSISIAVVAPLLRYLCAQAS